MSDAKVTPIRPDQQSCLAHVQPVARRLSGSHTIHGCENLRVKAFSIGEHRWIVLEIVDAAGGLHEINWHDLPVRLIGALVGRFADDRTKKGS